MTTQAESLRHADATASAQVERLSRGITATWWYTLTGILFLQLMLVVVWTILLVDTGRDAAEVITVGVGGLVWVIATVPLLLDYRNRSDAAPSVRRRRALIPLAIAIACGLAAGLVSGTWTLTVLPVVQSLVLLNWPPGVRRRMVLAATILLAALWAIDARFVLSADAGPSWVLVGFYSISLPVMTILTLWWWDVLVALDRARASEARLAATQERLRVATDVHDLQGHHLQVIALQLELAERLMAQDAGAALSHLQAARVSVDEARQGTRDLATRFRSVPLNDELANAVDLLRAAGAVAEATVDPDAGAAPASVFGPVIRETTTNVLRHGGGRWARLSLTRTGVSWRFEISNDADAEGPVGASGSRPGEHDGRGERDGAGGSGRGERDRAGGSGLDGIARRAAEAGGTLDIRREKQTFTVVVTVPSPPEEAR